MKLSYLSALTATLAAVAFVGCSSDQAAQKESEGTSSIDFNLTTAQGVVITSVNYDLNLSPEGTDVAAGAIPVPDPDSVISLGIESLAADTYSLVFSVVFRATPPDFGTGRAGIFPVWLFAGLIPWSFFLITVNTSPASWWCPTTM